MFLFENIFKFLGTLLVLNFPALGFSQFNSGYNVEERINSKKNYLGIEIVLSILPQAKITKAEGKYVLRSQLQSSYELGINYIHIISKSLNISTGVHFILGKRNFFVNIPSEDINNIDGSKLIEDKALWGSFKVPLLIEKKINYQKPNGFSLKAGLNIRYSGLLSDESITLSMIDPNNQVVKIFNAEISSRNNGKPWVTILTGISKSIVFDNKNFLSVSLQADISSIYFIKGNYQITIPNQQVTTGTYKINGTSLGVSVQYFFTGENKRTVRNYQKKGV